MCIDYKLLFFAFTLWWQTIDAKPLAGYKDSCGNYKWFEQCNDSNMVDSNQHAWTLVTHNQEKWNKAITIRNANIYALLLLGFDTLRVLKDVQLLQPNSILFTRFSRLENFEYYVSQWKNAFNSNNFTFNARLSSAISDTKLSLKYYGSKANITNVSVIGLVKRNFFQHLDETMIELFKKYSYRFDLFTIENYFDSYMHLNNAIELINEKKLQRDLNIHLTIKE